MAEKLTIEQMRQLIEHLESTRNLDENIPQSYVDRLERATQLLGEVKAIKAVDWDSMSTMDDLERAEAMVHRKLELKNDIERHFQTCGLTVSPRGRDRKEGRQRAPRRSKEQMEYDRKLAEIAKAKKAELGLPARGRITEEDADRLEAAIEEIKKQKMVAPR